MAGLNRDAAALFISQRLGESNGAAKPTTLYKEFRSNGGKARKQTFLNDYREIKTGNPKAPTPKPGAVKGGIVSGIMRRKDVKNLPQDQKQQLKKVAQRAVDSTAATGENPRQQMRIFTKPGGTIAVNVSMEWEEVENLPDGAEIPADTNIANFDQATLPILFDTLEHIYERLT